MLTFAFLGTQIPSHGTASLSCTMTVWTKKLLTKSSTSWRGKKKHKLLRATKSVLNFNISKNSRKQMFVYHMCRLEDALQQTELSLVKSGFHYEICNICTEGILTPPRKQKSLSIYRKSTKKRRARKLANKFLISQMYSTYIMFQNNVDLKRLSD